MEHNVVNIVASIGTFTALLKNGKILSWGYEHKQHRLEDVSFDMKENIKCISSTQGAFCAVNQDGQV